MEQTNKKAPQIAEPKEEPKEEQRRNDAAGTT